MSEGRKVNWIAREDKVEVSKYSSIEASMTISNHVRECTMHGLLKCLSVTNRVGVLEGAGEG
jgi:hypothetical protein